jgi:hypothetical protein
MTHDGVRREGRLRIWIRVGPSDTYHRALSLTASSGIVAQEPRHERRITEEDIYCAYQVPTVFTKDRSLLGDNDAP